MTLLIKKKKEGILLKFSISNKKY